MSEERAPIVRIADCVEAHTPALKDPETRARVLEKPSALLAMGIAFGLMLQDKEPAYARRVLQTLPRQLQSGFAIAHLLTEVPLHDDAFEES